MKKIDNLSTEELLELYRKENDQFAITELYNRLIAFRNRTINIYSHLFYCDIEAVYDDTFMYCLNKYDENNNAKFYTYLFGLLKLKIRTSIRKQILLESKHVNNDIIKNMLFRNYEEDEKETSFLEKYVADKFSVDDELFKEKLYSLIDTFTRNYLKDKSKVRREAVISFLTENATVKDLSIKYECSPQYIYEQRKIYRTKLINYLRKHSITRKDF